MLFTIDGIRALHGWTHDRTDQLIRHAATLSPALFVTPLEGFASATVREQLMHILSCEDNWIRRLQHIPRSPWRPEDFATADSLGEARTRVMAVTLKYLDGLSAEQLNTPLDRVPPEWLGPPRSPGFIFHHILTHAFHHKGQVVAMFRLLGHPAADTDLQRIEP
jgi:uncharacterized damage-inducible protein DinB